MGLRGPKSKPTRIKELQGNPGKRPLNSAEPKPQIPDAPPKPPTWFDKHAKAEWKRIAPELHRLGVLTIVDVGVLEMHCMAFGIKRRAELTLEEHYKKHQKLTSVYTNKAGATNETAIPELAIIKQQAEILKQTTAALGLSPADRSRITIDKPPLQKTNPVLAFLTQSG